MCHTCAPPHTNKHKVSVLDCHPIDNPITAEKAFLFVPIEFRGEGKVQLIIKAGFARLMVKWGESEFEETLGVWHV